MTRIALLLAAASCLLVAAPLDAQNSITTRQVGDITYYGGTLNGEPVTGSAQRFGDTIYYDLVVGGRPVSYTKQYQGGDPLSPAGQSSSTSASMPATGRTSTTSQGVTYTMQRIGNVIYTYGSNGCVKTTTLVGSRGRITGNCPE